MDGAKPHWQSGDRRCRARRKRTLERCRAWAVRGEAVCRVHGAGGGRPAIHGQRSTVRDRLRWGYERELHAEAAHFLRLGGRLTEREYKLLVALKYEPVRCRARSKRSGLRCRRRPTRGYLVCAMHGSRGGRPRADGREPGCDRVSRLRARMRRGCARLSWARMVRLADGLSIEPPPTSSELRRTTLFRSLLAEAARQATEAASASRPT